jgi:tripeptide aminopeptidase
MSVIESGVAARFMKYVQIDTQSDPNSLSFPSTAKQKNLSTLLVEELKSYGIEDAHIDTNGYVMATIPANTNTPSPVICFCAHVDTAPDCSGTDVRPILHQQYDGAPIVLPDDPVQIITTDQYPYLKKFIRKSIITASGKTLLGADDKAGVAIIMEMTKQLSTHTSITHGAIKILFTPDEEVGRGTEHLDIQKLGADFAYTLDGGELGCFEMETFSADGLTLYIDGVIAHPGAAKGVMQNAIKIAASIIDALPKDTLSPESTEGRKGFVHPHHISGGAESAIIECLVRDFETVNLAKHAQSVLTIAQEVIQSNPAYNKASVRMEVKEQYRNMREIIDQYPQIVERALAAYKKAGIEPIVEPIRGGTDGSRMSFMGLPTPNIFTGMQAIHSKHEWIGVEDMEKAVEVLVNLVEIN